MSRAIDLTGQRFGRLTVVERMGTDKKGNYFWRCKCSCEDETETVVAGRHLKDGKTKSCGCFRKEMALKMTKKRNQILCKEETMICLLTSKKYKNNTSGVKGISWNTEKQKWSVKIGFKKKQKHIGYFDTLEAAAKARALAEEEYFQPILDKYSMEAQNDS